MAISIRLSRGGSKKRPYYRIVVADARSPRDGKFIEKIGNYNPLLAKDDANRVKLDEDRARYWLGVGAQPQAGLPLPRRPADRHDAHRVVGEQVDALFYGSAEVEGALRGSVS